MVQIYVTMFSSNTKINMYIRDPLEQKDKSDLDTSELLGNEDTQKHQYLICSLK